MMPLAVGTHALLARQCSHVFFGFSQVADHSTAGFTQRRVYCRLFKQTCVACMTSKVLC